MERVRLHRRPAQIAQIAGVFAPHDQIARLEFGTRPSGRIVKRLGRQIGLPELHPHALRHAFVTLALDEGASLRDVQDAARHSDPRTTRRYDRAAGISTVR